MKTFALTLCLLLSATIATAQKMVVRANGTKHMHYIQVDRDGKPVRPVMKYHDEGSGKYYSQD